MKKCPKCNEPYEDMYDTCDRCSVNLSTGESVVTKDALSEGVGNAFDKNKILQSIGRLKFFFKGYVITICVFTIFGILGTLFPEQFEGNNIVITVGNWTLGIALLIFIVFRLFLIFSIRYVLRGIGKSWSSIICQQFCMLAFPIIDIILPLMVWGEAEEYLKAKENAQNKPTENSPNK